MEKCSNFIRNGCTGYVSGRGTILCTDCIQSKKSFIKNKREEDLLNEISRLKEEIILNKNNYNNLKAEYDEKFFLYTKEQETKYLELSNRPSINPYEKYQEQINKEILLKDDFISKIEKELKDFLKEKEFFKLTYEQNKIDIEKITMENNRLSSINKFLTEQNDLLIKENDLLKSKIL
jgi:hypothetical protein